MNNDQETSVECARWRERWEAVEKLPGGGQGEAFRAHRKIDGREAFVKVIKVKTDAERRARFFREANAYDTFRVGGVPRLIESNSHRHRDAEIEPSTVSAVETERQPHTRGFDITAQGPERRRQPASLQPCNRRNPHPWRQDCRYLSQWRGRLAQHPRRRLELPARRLLGAQEVALLPGM